MHTMKSICNKGFLANKLLRGIQKAREIKLKAHTFLILQNILGVYSAFIYT